MRNFQRNFFGTILFSSVIALLSGEARAQNWIAEANSSNGSIVFVAIGRPSALKIHGQGQGSQGQIRINGATIQGSLEFDLDSLSTGMSLRDRHMKEKYLETQKFRKAEFKFKKFLLPSPLAVNSKFEKIPFEGTLKLHGVETPVQGLVWIQAKSGKVEARAEFTTQIPRYSIPVPTFAGIKVADDVDVTVELKTELKETQ